MTIQIDRIRCNPLSPDPLHPSLSEFQLYFKTRELAYEFFNNVPEKWRESFTEIADCSANRYVSFYVPYSSPEKYRAIQEMLVGDTFRSVEEADGWKTFSRI